METAKEKELCTRCNVITIHAVEYKLMKDGRPTRRGICSECCINRALPLSDKDPGSYKINFGKHNGKLIKDIPRDYLKWLVSVDTMSKSVKAKVESFLLGGLQ